MKTRNLLVRGWLGVCLAVAGLGGAAADAPDFRVEVVAFDIKSQPIGGALNEFGRQSGLQILFYSDVARGLNAPAVVGTFRTEEALIQLLSQTGLTYSKVNERTIAIHPLVSGTGETQRVRNGTTPALMRLANTLQISEKFDMESDQRGSTQMQEGKTSDNDRRGATVLEEIVVTAQKRVERLIDVPQAVSVLSSDALAKLGAVQFRDFANTIPGLNVTTTGPGYTQISLRGVTAGFDISSTVGIYVDEVPFGSSTFFGDGPRSTVDVGLFDLERVEVLKGPQGTLYGASSMGGLIKYVTKYPDASLFTADAQTGISATRHGGIGYNGALTINAPVVRGKMAVRATGFYSHDGGYIDNQALDRDDVNQSDVYGGRADLMFTPTEALTVRITGFAQDITRDGEGTVDYSFSGAPLVGGLDMRRPLDEPFDQRFRLLSGTVTYALGPATLTSISSYQTMRGEFTGDLSPAYVPLLASVGLAYGAVGFFQDVPTDKFTQEVRFASNGNNTLDWLVGGFYTHEKSEYIQELVLRDVSGRPVPNNLYDIFSPSRYKEDAAFGDLTWHLSSDFDLTGGIRYARNRQEYTQHGSGLLVRSFPTSRSSEDVFTYLANARYKFSDTATGYVRYATGYRPGGPNFVSTDATTGLAVAPASFEADQLKSYEVGFKAEAEDRRFGVDAAVYYIDWSNIQINVIRGGFGAIENAPGGASVRGVELALTTRPTRSFALSAALAYQDARMAEADADLGAANRERLPNVPRFTAALSGEYELPVERFQPTVGASLRYIDDRRTSFDNSTSHPQYRLPEYTTVDLHAGLTFDPVTVQLFARNLFDKRGQVSAFTWRGLPQVAVLQPLTVGISLITHF